MPDPIPSASSGAPAPEASASPSSAGVAAPEDAKGTAAAGAPPEAKTNGKAEPAKEPAQESEDPALSKLSPAAKSRAITKEMEARKKLNEERAKLQAEIQRLGAVEAKAKALEEDLAAFRKDPLTWAEKNGVTYEEMTKAAIGRFGKNTAEARLENLEKQYKADKDAAEASAKARAVQAEEDIKQANIQRYLGGVLEHAATNKTDYELLNLLEPDYAKDMVFDVADEFARRTGQILSAKEACDMIESYLIDEGVKYAKAEKVKAKLAPPPEKAPEKKETAVTDPVVKAELDKIAAKKEAEKARKTPTTLTNRLSASPQRKSDQPLKKMSRKDAINHAIATVWGPTKT